MRHYEDRGLLVSSRTSTGYREFGAEAVGTVAHIRRLPPQRNSTPWARGSSPE
ncbi:MerR family transcriptional regulator [Brevibacterium sanguinis]|uniref:MerR family transcriptional regulator n=1 Tax=Brevibacterium sanguinis TaxID=232444 RepID=UPI003CD0759B